MNRSLKIHIIKEEIHGESRQQRRKRKIIHVGRVITDLHFPKQTICTSHLGGTAAPASCWAAALLTSHGLAVEPSSVEEGGEYSDLLKVEAATTSEHHV
jgi:hypothetical protein